MDDMEIFALMSRIHVILRHHENRIADVAQMQVNADYSREILSLCMKSTNAELVRLGIKLNEGLFGEQGKFTQPERKPLQNTLRESSTVSGQSAAAPAAAGEPAPDPDKKKYIRTLR
jgi:hypothetical protein